MYKIVKYQCANISLFIYTLYSIYSNVENNKYAYIYANQAMLWMLIRYVHECLLAEPSCPDADSDADLKTGSVDTDAD